MNNDILSRYEKAQTFLHPDASHDLVLNDSVFPHWIDGHTFWYKKNTPEGHEFRMVDAQSATNKIAFNHQTLADVLGCKTQSTVNPDKLPLMDLSFNLSRSSILFNALDKAWSFDLNSSSCEEITRELDSTQQLMAPDGQQALFVRDYNLWLRDQTSLEEKQLTHDGIKNCAYACPNAFTDPSLPTRGAECGIEALWSNDSQRILTTQFDTQGVTIRNDTNYLPANGLHKEKFQTTLSYLGDDVVESNRLAVIDITNGTVTKANHPRLPMVLFGDTMPGFFSLDLGWWSDDNQRAFFIDITEGSKKVSVVELNADTGDTKIVFEETADPYVKLRHSQLDRPMIVPPYRDKRAGLGIWAQRLDAFIPL